MKKLNRKFYVFAGYLIVLQFAFKYSEPYSDNWYIVLCQMPIVFYFVCLYMTDKN